MKLTLIFLASLYIDIANSQTFEFLNINQVKAMVNSSGDFNWDPSSNFNVGYECPMVGQKYWAPARLWLGGLDAGGQLHVAAQTYRQAGFDFWAGPLTTSSASTNSLTVSQYDRVWKLNKSDIDDFLLNLANGNVQNGSFIPAPDLLSWPGNGDISQNYSATLAPFFDADGDNIYNPMVGDYPIIKGDQAIYTIFNDNFSNHQSSLSSTIGAEFHLMAYAYGPCSITTSNDFLNYTTFYNFKIINRSSTTLLNTYASLFNDIDLWAYIDDYVGCDVADHYTYFYDSPTATGNQPAIGIVQLKGPINTTNNIDDNEDGITDEPGENMSMTNFMYFNNSFSNVQPSQSDPSNGVEYYHYMRSLWRDASPLTCGGNGYGGTIPTNFAYANNTYSNSPCGLGSWVENGIGSDKKRVMSSGPYTLQPGEIVELEYAYIMAFDSITNSPLTKLDLAVQNLHSIYNSTLNQCLNTSVKEQNNQMDYLISPNPTNGQLNIELNKTTTNISIEIIDAVGKKLIQQNLKVLNQTTIDVSSLSSGIYFLKLTSEGNSSTKKFIKAF